MYFFLDFIYTFANQGPDCVTLGKEYIIYCLGSSHLCMQHGYALGGGYKPLPSCAVWHHPKRAKCNHVSSVTFMHELNLAYCNNVKICIADKLIGKC